MMFDRKEYMRKYRIANRVRLTLADKLWRELNQDRVDVYNEGRRLSPQSEASAKWDTLNRGRKNTHEANRRAKNRLAEGSFTPQEWTDLCGEYRNLCLRCLQSKPLTRDHVIPLSQGGSNWITNIQPLCKECNSAKGTKSTDYRVLY